MPEKAERINNDTQEGHRLMRDFHEVALFHAPSLIFSL